MKITKLIAIIVLILALLTISLSGYAQDKEPKVKKSPEERAKISTEKMKTSLNLSDEQSSRIYDLKLQSIKDQKEFKERKSKLNSDRRKKGSEYKNSMKSILTEEQYNNMKKMHKEKKDTKTKNKHRNKTKG
jgi:hypothetical protein